MPFYCRVSREFSIVITHIDPHPFTDIDLSMKLVIVQKTGEVGYLTPLLKASSAWLSFSVSSNKIRAYCNRTSASLRGCNLQF